MIGSETGQVDFTVHDLFYAHCHHLQLLTSKNATGQDTVLNKYGLWVLHSIPQFQMSIEKKPGYQMTDLKKLIPALVLDLRYAGTNNFMNEKLYPPITTTWLRKTAADSADRAPGHREQGV